MVGHSPWRLVGHCGFRPLVEVTRLCRSWRVLGEEALAKTWRAGIPRALSRLVFQRPALRALTWAATSDAFHPTRSDQWVQGEPHSGAFGHCSRTTLHDNGVAWT